MAIECSAERILGLLKAGIRRRLAKCRGWHCVSFRSLALGDVLLELTLLFIVESQVPIFFTMSTADQRTI